MDYLTLPAAINPEPRSAGVERAKRRAAIDYARGSMRLEGFALGDHMEDLNRRYSEGGMTSAEHSAAVRALHGL